ncbi:hypothetical protein A2U01_0100383 [Trifolium medium]|uniref:Uncharacterized protein n=1 Tax=Trifolium medium TaxID=97028 RepID=A0A392UVG1_9FABA|nr:hypothetical protein [Trifolium medium]
MGAATRRNQETGLPSAPGVIP